MADTLNIKAINPNLPDEFKGYYDEVKYKKSQNYLKTNTGFSLIKSTLMTILIVVFIVVGGFNWLDGLARSFNQGPVITGLIFLCILLLINLVISFPFSIYHTFVIEEKFGFNKTTVKTFILDLIKGIIISLIIGSAAFSCILWFFEKTGPIAWVYCWLFVAIFQLFIIFIAPNVIMPLFNKFLPLDDGELKEKIKEYASSQNFNIKGVYKMDGSKRSTKSNAFFTGLGKSRRIVLFDTLIEKHTVAELVAVIAHEVGHYKKRHILKNFVYSILTTGLMFYLLSLMMNNIGLFDAFKMDHVSTYASFILFSFLYSPISSFFSIIDTIFSRKYEYEADSYAAKTTNDKDSMITALKKLSVDNLSNLTPHWLKVFLEYSHPPVLARIKALKN